MWHFYDPFDRLDDRDGLLDNSLDHHMLNLNVVDYFPGVSVLDLGDYLFNDLLYFDDLWNFYPSLDNFLNEDGYFLDDLYDLFDLDDDLSDDFDLSDLNLDVVDHSFDLHGPVHLDDPLLEPLHFHDSRHFPDHFDDSLDDGGHLDDSFDEVF